MGLEKAIEEIIRKAQQEGHFDNLEGAGQPLKLDENPFEEPEWRLANRVLKNAGFRPAWLELDAQLREGLERARQDLARSRAWRDERLGALKLRTDAQAASDREWVVEEWDRALAGFREAVEEINRGIAGLNLKVPLERLQRQPIDLARELQRMPET